MFECECVARGARNTRIAVFNWLLVIKAYKILFNRIAFFSATVYFMFFALLNASARFHHTPTFLLPAVFHRKERNFFRHNDCVCVIPKHVRHFIHMLAISCADTCTQEHSFHLHCAPNIIFRRKVRKRESERSNKTMQYMPGIL